MRDIRRRAVPALLVTVLVVLALTGCSTQEAQGGDVDTGQVDAVDPPAVGACRVLAPEDVARPANATRTVDCTEPHTAETIAVPELPAALDDASYDDEAVGRFAYRACGQAFMQHLEADESMVMRTVVSWAWFRPSETAWDDGARWVRCDLVGGGEESVEYVDLPADTRGLLEGLPDDEWMVCVRGESVTGADRIPCSEPHDWRAVTTIKLGDAEDPYPGDRLVEVRTRDFCSDSVGAWLEYPVTYDFAYTWFHEAEWEVGNRRSVCWAKTDR